MDEPAKALKALSEPIRLRMINLLAHSSLVGGAAGGQDELCVCDLMAVLDLPQSTASRHLGYLKNAGWVTDRRSRKWVYYRMTPGLPEWRRKLFDSLLSAFSYSPMAQEDVKALDAFLRNKDRNCSEAA